MGAELSLVVCYLSFSLVLGLGSKGSCCISTHGVYLTHIPAPMLLALPIPLLRKIFFG